MGHKEETRMEYRSRVARRELVRIVVLGVPGVGKTAFITRFLDDTFPSDYQPTNIGYHTRHVQTTDERLQLVYIVELSCRKDMSADKNNKIREGEAFLVLYAVNDRKSMKGAIKICKRVYDIKESNEIPLILIGHKTDLQEDRGMKLEKRLNKVDKKLKCRHSDASAKLKVNVKPIFQALIDLALTKAMCYYYQTRNSRLRCDHMPPLRFSKFAIPKLLEEDVIRNQKQDESTIMTSETSTVFGQHGSPRPSQNSGDMLDEAQSDNQLLDQDHSGDWSQNGVPSGEFLPYPSPSNSRQCIVSSYSHLASTDSYPARKVSWTLIRKMCSPDYDIPASQDPSLMSPDEKVLIRNQLQRNIKL